MTVIHMPVVVLAGSDGTGGPVPGKLTETDMLTGCKGAIELPTGNILAQELNLRLKNSNWFDPVLLLGPSKIYAGRVDCEIIDVTGNLPEVFERLRTTLYTRFDPQEPVAVCTADLLPSTRDLQLLMEQSYAPHQSCSFWWELVRADQEEMGQSDWKPTYHFRDEQSVWMRDYYPGHLAVIRPAALRMRLLSYLLALSYRYRNKNIHQRLLPMTLQGGGRFVFEDLRNLFRGQWPTLTWTVFSGCFQALKQYRREALTLNGFAKHLSRLIVHRDYREPGMPEPVVVSSTELISFAKDIDTRQELEELLSSLRESLSHSS